MATIKSYSDLQQSKKLAEILLPESADMFYCYGMDIDSKKWDYDTVPTIIDADNQTDIGDIPCWSLAALLGVASTYCSRLEVALRADKKYNVFAVKDDFVFRSFDDHPDGFDNLVDACVTMIEKLHELKML